MQDWEVAFAEKSERRRKRSQLRQIIRWTMLVFLVAVGILAGLWLVDRSFHFLMF
ncbi:MAG TPA: hypothetical protein VMK31_05300 [Sphingomicrobium sp.]|nr:hypothetical protein [Sphingomicrobium sp.]